ncbi:MULTISPECIES: PssD/Cps14F family polysaccharide biosynthesis glycosyltransferase [Clostridia]|uniref:PssD/Cps14F family polysaccharide biosynthesis glycosyltransferase n=1 Tax=Clostridia TaxID=186801 RepID=UPI00067EE70C|nr:MULTISPECIES: PssD/Cps14F family polysaccharide biosynthesis glycosyltransferase [Clostridia]
MVDKGQSKKLCFAASSGGHFEQIAMLKPLMDKYESCVVTERTEYKSSIKGQKMHYLHQVNRKEVTFPFWMIVNALKSIKIIIEEKPDMVISTGVLAMIPLCLITKFLRKKLIYIESFAKISSPTESGKLIYKFADQFYVQWESMLKFYPNAIYLGGIY